MKTLRILLAALMPTTLVACLLPPSRSVRTPFVSGRVVDSVTRLPIAKANVFFLSRADQAPLQKPNAFTDAQGSFTLERTYSYHVASLALGLAGIVDLPGGRFSSTLRIEHPDHEPKIVEGLLEDVHLGDISIARKH